MQDTPAPASDAATMDLPHDATAAMDGSRGDDSTEEKEADRQMNRQIPWQMEWKHPQWITTSSPPTTVMEEKKDDAETEDVEVVGITSARLSHFEISHILSFGNATSKTSSPFESLLLEEPKPTSDVVAGEDNHYLLTVTLLGKPINEKRTATSETVDAKPLPLPPRSLASEVLLEVVDVPSASPGSVGKQASAPSSTAASTVICSKRLRWPESIFDADSKPKAKGKQQTRQRAKRKNLLASVFLPLMGIDEEDEYGREKEVSEKLKDSGAKNIRSGTAQAQAKEQPAFGIVSATLCRRPEEEMLAKSKQSVTKDIVELMSFGASGDGVGRMGDDANGGEHHSLGQDKALQRASVVTPSKTMTTRSNSEAACGELAFACVTQAGEVFVYDPIKLLLGIEENASNLRETDRDAKKNLEEASNFFFGAELFQNLQETWKPLAEPSTRIHLSLFEHNNNNNNNNNNEKKERTKASLKSNSNSETTRVEHTMVQSNQELSKLAHSLQARDNPSTGSSTKESRHKGRQGNVNQRHGPGGGGASIGSQGSVSTFRSAGGDGDSSTIATSATDALTAVQTMAQELQNGVDDALSMLPYLLNPLLEPSTLKDRTVQNQPLDISVTGSFYVVVTGSGRKRKIPPKNFNITNNTRHGRDSADDASASLGSASETSNGGTLSSRGSRQKLFQGGGEAWDPKETKTSGETNANEEELPGNPISDVTEATKDSGGETETNAPHLNENADDVEDHSKAGERIEIEETTESGAWWENDSNADPEDKAAENAEDGIEETTETVAWWENDSNADQEDKNENYNEGGSKGDVLEENKIDGARVNENVASAGDQDDNSSNKESINSQTGSPIGHDGDNSQRHYFDGYENDNKGDETRDRGGFVTFLSTARWSETRTLFLPFVPVRTSHISQWNGMELLWVIGEFETLLIRMDSTGPVPVTLGDVVLGGDQSDNDADIFQTATSSNRTNSTVDIGSGNELSPLSVKRFQVLPIDLGLTAAISPRLLCASNTGIDPPSIMELHVDPDTKSKKGMDFEEETFTDNKSRFKQQRYQQASVLLKTLGYCSPQGTVFLRHAPSHVAKIMIDEDEQEDSVLAEHGQGWSLVGHNSRIYFICWEGSTLLQGAYVQELGHSPCGMPHNAFHTTHILPLSLTRNVSIESKSSQHHSKKLRNEGIDPLGRSSEGDQLFENPQRFSSAIANLPVIDEFKAPLSPNPNDSGQFSADIFSLRVNNGLLSDSLKSTSFSRRQNSEYLLQQCSSWTQLEDTLSDRIVLERQEPLLCLRSGKTGSPHNMLSIRQLVVENGVSSPFQQVLAWLAKRKNFFVAAGIALDLLQDAGSLHHLWKNAEMIDEEDEETKLFGLLDGIAPVRLLEDNQKENEHNYSVTATHLSEMTVGCFIKGGVSMAKTLERFLEYNESYDPARVSLMLSLTTIDLFDPIRIRNRKTLTSITSHDEEFFEGVLWPVKCLLRVGTEREYLHEVLTLLNNTIPDELRHRHSEDEKEEETISTPTLALTKSLIRLILESDTAALEILMGFVDDRSQTTFWQSLDHSTRLALSLMDIDSSFPFLRHPDARSWARGELDSCFQGNSELPTPWLQELSLACLRNGNFDIDDLRVIADFDDGFLETAKPDASDTTRDTGVRKHNVGNLTTGCRENPVQKMKVEIEKTRNALLPSTDKGYGIDHDLLIPSLLLLENRNAHWLPPPQLPTSTESPPNEELYVPTQSLLNAACYLAGRAAGPANASAPAHCSAVTNDRSSDEPFLFASFDGKSAMKQCYQAKNVVAGAYLIGGKNGFILHVCAILNRGIGISIPDAESFLLNDRLDLKKIEESRTATTSFELTDEHQELLLLLDEHVLGIKTFGDFDFAHNRGKVDPVFAARSILRAWLSLSLDDKATASSWLGDWLTDRLDMRTLSSSSLSVSVTASEETPRSKTDAAKEFDFSDSDKNPEGNSSQYPTRNKNRLACASLVRSLLWANNKATPKISGGNADGEASPGVDYESAPLAATMKFEKKLLIELCQSCLGLVESVPPAVVREIQI